MAGAPAGRLVLMLGAALASLVLLGWLAGAAVEGVSGFGQTIVDGPVAEELAERQSPSMTQAMKAVTWLGNRGVVLLAMALASVGLWAATGDRRPPLFLCTSVLGGYVVSHLVKDLVQRVRPVEGLVHASGGSFPSGHAVASVTLYGGLAMVVWRLSAGGPGRGAARRRSGAVLGAGAWAVAVLLILSIGASRVYLGVHWTSDVIGGALLGGAWTAACTRTWSKWPRDGL